MPSPAVSAIQVPRTQSAWFAVNRGLPGPSTLILKNNAPVPSKLAPNEVLVKVEAAALNPIGYKLLGTLPNFLARRPLVPEHDFAGLIADGNGTGLRSGDSVFGWVPKELNIKSSQGALQQYVRVPTDHVAPRPSNISAPEACICLAVLTAYQALFDIGKLEAGQTVLINGGSSSVGAFAIQLAKIQGIRVVATASAKNEDLVRSLGADEFIDYTREPLHSFLIANPPTPKYHLIFDAVGLVDPALYINSPAYLAPGGMYVSTGPTPSWNLREIWLILKTFTVALLPTYLGGVERGWSLIPLRNDKAQLDKVALYLAEGKLKPLVDTIFPFPDLYKAYDRLMSKRARGKVVVDVTAAANLK